VTQIPDDAFAEATLSHTYVKLVSEMNVMKRTTIMGLIVGVLHLELLGLLGVDVYLTETILFPCFGHFSFRGHALA
jgi:hypothetical protein